MAPSAIILPSIHQIKAEKVDLPILPFKSPTEMLLNATWPISRVFLQSYAAQVTADNRPPRKTAPQPALPACGGLVFAFNEASFACPSPNMSMEDGS